jgi:N-acetylneuraminate synthase
VDHGRQSSDKANVQFRRSKYSVKDLKAGDVITADAIRSVRLGYGFAPEFGPQVVGRQLKHYVTRHKPVEWSQW